MLSFQVKFWTNRRRQRQAAMEYLHWNISEPPVQRPPLLAGRITTGVPKNTDLSRTYLQSGIGHLKYANAFCLISSQNPRIQSLT